MGVALCYPHFKSFTELVASIHSFITFFVTVAVILYTGAAGSMSGTIYIISSFLLLLYFLNLAPLIVDF
jgi:hypothetical protein